MHCLNLLFLLVAVTSTASACKYFCRTPGTFEYECCDEGNPYFNEDEVSDKSEETVAPQADTKTEAAVEPENTATNAEGSSHCYYYCAYGGEVYCCGDDSRPIPDNHDMNDGRCPEEEEQICKSTGIFLNSKKVQGKTSGAIRLVSGPGKEQPACASDGYCSEEEKCCPSKCARKHICMKSIPEE